MHVLIWAGPRSWSFELDDGWLAALLEMAGDVDGRPWIQGQAWEKENKNQNQRLPPSSHGNRHRRK